LDVRERHDSDHWIIGSVAAQRDDAHIRRAWLNDDVVLVDERHG
jgi:hypothetical protein